MNNNETVIHVLKIHPEYFRAVKIGEKRFEVRKDDGRNFKVGDILVLQEYDAETGTYTGNKVQVKITYIMSDSRYCAVDYKILSINPVAKWIRHYNKETFELWYTCSECGDMYKKPVDYDEYQDNSFAFAECNYCPVCGCEMVGEEDADE